MAQAIRLAEQGRYTTQPNPRVGCVLVKDNQIVGRGYHRYAGQPHAERIALADAADEARGATAYVTLEPCAHTGRTPPCADALIEAGVTRVVMAMTDPNPLVNGQGRDRLIQAGIQVDAGLMQAQAEALNPGFIKRMTQAMPYVRCKLAMSLDGRTAMASGESKWITSDDARKDVHRLRASSHAIVTGIGTILADDPSMNVRLSPQDLGLSPDESFNQPLKVVLDPELDTPVGARILEPSGSTWIFHRKDIDTDDHPLLQTGALLKPVEFSDSGLDLTQILNQLAVAGYDEVMIEAGARLAGSFMTQGLIDSLVVYVAPHVMGDAARGMFHLPGLEAMSERHAMTWRDVRRVGPDLRLVLEPA